MSERAKMIVKIALLIVSVVAITLLIFSIIDHAMDIRQYEKIISEISLDTNRDDEILFYRQILSELFRQLFAVIISIICLAGLNAYIWFFHKIPSAEERAQIAAERKEKKKQKLQEELDKLEK